MRRSVYERDLERPFGKLLLHEITHEELRALCDKIVARGAPATAVHAREIVMMVFRYAGQRGHEHPNPADKVPPWLAIASPFSLCLQDATRVLLHQIPQPGARRQQGALRKSRLLSV